MAVHGCGGWRGWGHEKLLAVGSPRHGDSALVLNKPRGVLNTSGCVHGVFLQEHCMRAP